MLQPSCTAGRASFITGQYPIRTGLTTVSFVGSPLGMQALDATLAEVLKTVGYATGQFGKNHLGDRNEHLPTVHGFDQFFGNLYHLNTEEEPEDEDFPRDPEFKEKHGPRGVLRCVALDADNPDKPATDRFGPWGRQRCEDTGPLTRKRMETVDREVIDASLEFIEKAKGDAKPFFVWLKTTRMHTFTHVPQKYQEMAREHTSYNDLHGAGMIRHDEEIGVEFDRLDELDLAENTIVIYSTDNGPEHSTYPHGGTTPFRSEKMTTWEGGVRVPMMVRWPGQIEPRTELNGIQAHMDLFTTLAAAAGVTDIQERLSRGDRLNTDTEKKGYIDGMNNLDYWTGKTDQSARNEYIYYAEANLQAIRVNQWKMHFSVRDGYYGTSETLELPWLYNVRQDPFESYNQVPIPPGNLIQHKSYMFNAVTERIFAHLETLKEFPPSQRQRRSASTRSSTTS